MSLKLPLGLPWYQCLILQTRVFQELFWELKLHRSKLYSQSFCRALKTQATSMWVSQKPLTFLKSPQINVENTRQDFLPSYLSVYRYSSIRQLLGILGVIDFSFPNVSSFWVLIHSNNHISKPFSYLSFSEWKSSLTVSWKALKKSCERLERQLSSERVPYSCRRLEFGSPYTLRHL